MLEVASPKPAAQTWPLSFCVHHNQFGRVCTAEKVCAPAGTPGGAGGLLLDGELLEGEPLEGELFAGEPLDGDPEGDPEPDGPEPDDGGSAGCAGVTTGVCGWEAAIVDEGFPPHAANASRRKSITTTNAEFL